MGFGNSRTLYEEGKDFAERMDSVDDLRAYQSEFYFPDFHEKEVIYLCGNSLGLQPKSVEQALQNEVEQWRKYGVEGHFEGALPWMYYHKFLLPQTAALVGALESEVVIMNTLTTNLHLLMVSFYRPTKKRFKILVEADGFPSDQYAMESQARFHGFDPEEAVIEIMPRSGEVLLRSEDIVSEIQKHGDELALVMFAGVHYYTGQLFDMQTITQVAHEVGAIAGFDLAHATGNVVMKLHDWKVDFAVWCSYKYLNSGPGGPGGIFVHEKHGDNPDLVRFAGWWGHDEKERFLMKKGYKPMSGAAGWQLSNAQIFSFAAHKASLDIFDRVGIQNLRKKSVLLTGYLEFLIDSLNKKKQRFEVITPRNPDQRGCQLSFYTRDKNLHALLTDNGVISDWRDAKNGIGGVVRVAPVPMYNSFL